jgi:hypothetical protein
MDTHYVFIINRFSMLRPILVLASLILAVGCHDISASTTMDRFPLTADPKWMQCQSDKNCVVSFGPCGEWVAVNQVFKKEQQAWAIERGAELGCPENKSPKPTAVCRNRVCTTRP